MSTTTGEKRIYVNGSLVKTSKKTPVDLGKSESNVALALKQSGNWIASGEERIFVNGILVKNSKGHTVSLGEKKSDQR